MAGPAEPPFRKVRVEIAPFFDPDAQDHYANFAGVGFTESDVVLVFTQLFPTQITGQTTQVSIKPTVRITLPPKAAADLADKIRQQLQERRALEEHIAKEGAGGESEPSDS